MNLIEPGRTPWDLQFNIGSIPVRVHPMFWLVSLIFSGLGQIVGIDLVIGIVIIFVSILLHELGHAFTMLYYGDRPRVVLYWMGGLAISGGDIWDLGYRTRARSPQQQIAISFAGPAAGFLLAVLTIGFIYAIGGSVEIIQGRVFPQLIVTPFDLAGPSAMYALNVILFVNVFWGLVNLLPVFPLDGGQIARQFFILADPYGGVAKSLWLSVIVGAAMAVLGVMSGSLWTGMLFGSMAFGSWQMLQNSGYGGRGW